MKKKIFLFFFLFYGIANIYGQYSSFYKNDKLKLVVKNNLLSIFVNSLNLSIETKVKNNQSIQGVVQINNDRRRYSSWFTSLGDIMNTNGYSIGLEYRFYSKRSGNTLTGGYVSPYFRYIYRDIHYIPDSNYPPPSPYGSMTFKRNVYTFGVLFGTQDVFKFNYLGFDLFGGIGARYKSDYDFETAYEVYEIEEFADQLLEIRLGLNLILSNIKSRH